MEIYVQYKVKVPRKNGGFANLICDVVNIDGQWLWRKYTVSRAKTSYSTAYGQTKKINHKNGPWIQGGFSSCVENKETGEAELLGRIKQYTISKVKNPVIYEGCL